jgi:hypothetical protein
MINDLEAVAHLILRETPARFFTAVPSNRVDLLDDSFIEPMLMGAKGESVEPMDAVGRSRGVMILAPPGGGKTTLLRILAIRQARAFIDRKNSRCPVFLPARALRSSRNEDLAALIAPVLGERYGFKDTDG